MLFDFDVPINFLPGKQDRELYCTYIDFFAYRPRSSPMGEKRFTFVMPK